MKLYLSPTSPYARLCVITALRSQQEALQLEFVLPWENPENLLTANPYGQVPALCLDDGRIVSESLFIMQQLNPAVLSEQPEKSSFGFTTINVAVKAFALAAHGDSAHPHPHIERSIQALRRALAQTPDFNPDSDSWGDIILGVGLNYVALRLPEIFAEVVSTEHQAAVKRFNERDFMQKTTPERFQLKPARVADL